MGWTRIEQEGKIGWERCDGTRVFNTAQISAIEQYETSEHEKIMNRNIYDNQNDMSYYGEEFVDQWTLDHPHLSFFLPIIILGILFLLAYISSLFIG